MTTELTPSNSLSKSLSAQSLSAGPDAIALLLADKRSEATRRAYRGDLADFFDSQGGDPAPGDLAAFLALDAPAVALRLATYKNALLARGLAEATVNRRLAAIRSLLKFSHRLGLSKTDGRGLVDGERVRAYRDTRGVDVKTLKKLLALPERLHGESLHGRRDAALLRLLAENALRRAEVCALNVGDFSLSERRLMVLGKGKGTQKSPVTLSARCAAAISGYLAASGHGGGDSDPLFRNLDRRHTRSDPAHAAGRLTPDGLHDLIGRYGRHLGLDLSPHKMRHAAITAALDATKGDVRRVQRLSRHADLRTLTIYDDNRTDLQGEVTGMLSRLL